MELLLAIWDFITNPLILFLLGIGVVRITLQYLASRH